MSATRIAILSFDGRAAAETSAAAIHRCWPDATRPSIDCVDAAQCGDLTELDAVVIVAGDETDPATRALVRRLEESRGAVLILTTAPEASTGLRYSGAVVRPRSIGDEALASTVQALTRRQDAVRELRAEAALAERFQGGLSGQMSKMHDELQLAAVVQREFLPRPVPALHGIECAALWRPTNYVSGDLYDIIRLDEDHLGLFLADCIGHGVPAALMTMVVHRSLAVKDIVENDYRLVPPAEVLDRLNADLFRRQGTTARFVTAVYALLDCRRRVLTIAGGGHPPPLVLAADGSTSTIETEGGLIGVFEDATFDQREVTMREDDRLLIYSDGFEQAFPDPDADDYGRRLPNTRYLDEFRELRDLPGSMSMIESLARRLSDQPGSLHQTDDLTCLCVHAGPPPEPTLAAAGSERSSWRGSRTRD